MIRYALLAAAIVALLAAAGPPTAAPPVEYQKVLGGCGCEALPAYRALPSRLDPYSEYCPKNLMPRFNTCDITLMETEPCKITCFGDGIRLTFHSFSNNGNYWSSRVIKSMTCANGLYTTETGETIIGPFNFMCGSRSSCAECVPPLSTTDLTLLPALFRTGFTAGEVVYLKEAESCSTINCPNGYMLYGFSNTSATVTGLEYTSKGYLKCDGNSQWTNVGSGTTPSDLLVACLKPPSPCADCQMEGVPGTYTKTCLGESNVVSCLSGQINVSLSGNGNEYSSMDRVTCTTDGSWIGSTCSGKLYVISTPSPSFFCPDVLPPTTLPPTSQPPTVPTVPTDTTVPTISTVPTPTTTGPTVPPVLPPCTCDFEDVGAELKLDAPITFCTDGLIMKQMLQCDGKIYVKNGDALSEFDSVFCAAGQWYGTGCNGSPLALNAASISVQCGFRAEPPLCPQLPSRGGLIFVGLENGLQRYTCRGDELARITIQQGLTVHAKYFDCNSTYYRAGSSNGDYWANQDPIVEFSCRDYGSINKACSIPYFANAYLQDGAIRCVKGFHPITTRFTFLDEPESILEINGIYRARCEETGWRMDVSEASEAPFDVQLTAFSCTWIPSSFETCGALDITSRNVQYSQESSMYHCFNNVYEEMEVITPSDVFYGVKLVCVFGVWQFTGAATVTIPAGSKVSCHTYQTGVIPRTATQLIFAGMTADALRRWTCIDSTLTVDFEISPGEEKTLQAHAAYIEGDNSKYRFSSSLDYQTPGLTSDIRTNKINSISCIDMGAKHSTCTDPWDIGGIRRGNIYECQKGYFLQFILWVDEAGDENLVPADAFDMKSMQCNRDGWELQGTSLSGLRVSGFSCREATPMNSYSDCSTQTIQFGNKLQFDRFRKFYTCYEGESLGYTLNSVNTHGKGKKLFCGKNSSNAPEWQWSFMDGTQAAPIPEGAKITCF